MLGQRFPVPCDEDSGEAVPVSMQFMEVHGGEDGCPKEVVLASGQVCGDHTGAGLLEGLVIL